MNNKCEWKGGKFEVCGDFDYAKRRSNLIVRYSDTGKAYLKENGNLDQELYFCPFCGADIRKPVEKPLIVKSGNTWVAHYKGVDYLCLKPDVYASDLDNRPETINMEFTAPDYWKPFSEIELTDEIARLQPLIKSDGYGLCHLIAMSVNELFTVSYIDHGEWGCRTVEPKSSFKGLATAKELQNEV